MAEKPDNGWPSLKNENFANTVINGLVKRNTTIKVLLAWAGENPKREGLLDTPKRVIKAFEEYFSGYLIDPYKDLEKTFGDVEGYDDKVIQKNISIYSHCEHHMAPIVGVAHVAYLPHEKVVGLSKLARVVEAYSRRLQTQEINHGNCKYNIKALNIWKVLKYLQ